MKPPPKEYQQPTYVGMFYLTALLCLIGGGISLVIALTNGDSPFFAIGLLLAAGINLLYANMANDLARAAWQTARTAYDLQPVIEEANRQRSERTKQEEKARLAQEAEIRRAITAQHLAKSDAPED